MPLALSRSAWVVVSGALPALICFAFSGGMGYTCVRGLQVYARYAPVTLDRLDAKVVYVQDSDHNGHSVIAKYAYTMNGVQYTSDRVRWFVRIGSKSRADKSLQEILSRSPAYAYVDSVNPSLAVLEWDNSVWMPGIISVLAGVIGIAIIWHSTRSTPWQWNNEESCE